MKIVVWDPTGLLNDGTVVEGTNEIGAIERRGAILLPVDDNTAQGSVDGYFKRSWGTGWQFTERNKRGCPMIMQVATGKQYVYWAALVAPVLVDREVRGNVRLTTDSSNQRAMSGGMSSQTMPMELHAMLEHPRGGWVVGGRSTLNLTMEGMVALNLYGVTTNARVLWSAVTQCSRLEAILGAVDI